jgi:hypothetical protein
MSHVKIGAHPLFQASLRFVVAMLLLLCCCEAWADDQAGAENRQKEVVRKKAVGEAVSQGQTRQTGSRDVRQNQPRPGSGPSSSAGSDPLPVQQQPASPSGDNPRATANRDPTRIQQEFESQVEEAKPPKIRVTGVIESKGQKYAVAELDLEDFKGMVMLKPGMTVSIPKSKKGKSESKNWMTYFKVTDIVQNMVLLQMENGEKITIPVMGEKSSTSTK